jgi:hypothetical protein
VAHLADRSPYREKIAEFVSIFEIRRRNPRLTRFYFQSLDRRDLHQNKEINMLFKSNSVRFARIELALVMAVGLCAGLSGTVHAGGGYHGGGYHAGYHGHYGRSYSGGYGYRSYGYYPNYSYGYSYPSYGCSECYNPSYYSHGFGLPTTPSIVVPAPPTSALAAPTPGDLPPSGPEPSGPVSPGSGPPGSGPPRPVSPNAVPSVAVPLVAVPPGPASSVAAPPVQASRPPG